MCSSAYAWPKYPQRPHVSDELEIEPLIDPAQLVRAKAAYAKALRAADPLDEPFTPALAHRLVLYSTYEPDHDLGQTICAAARSLDEHFAYLTWTDPLAAGRPFATTRHWRIALRPRGLPKAPLSDDTGSSAERYALYSSRGRWALVASKGLPCLLGADQAFRAALTYAAPYIERDVLWVLRDVGRTGGIATATASRIDALINQVYGIDEAARLRGLARNIV